MSKSEAAAGATAAAAGTPYLWQSMRDGISGMDQSAFFFLSFFKLKMPSRNACHAVLDSETRFSKQHGHDRYGTLLLPVVLVAPLLLMSGRMICPMICRMKRVIFSLMYISVLFCVCVCVCFCSVQAQSDSAGQPKVCTKNCLS